MAIEIPTSVESARIKALALKTWTALDVRFRGKSTLKERHDLPGIVITIYADSMSRLLAGQAKSTYVIDAHYSPPHHSFPHRSSLEGDEKSSWRFTPDGEVTREGVLAGVPSTVPPLNVHDAESLLDLAMDPEGNKSEAKRLSRLQKEPKGFKNKFSKARRTFTFVDLIMVWVFCNLFKIFPNSAAEKSLFLFSNA